VSPSPLLSHPVGSTVVPNSEGMLAQTTRDDISFILSLRFQKCNMVVATSKCTCVLIFMSIILKIQYKQTCEKKTITTSLYIQKKKTVFLSVCLSVCFLFIFLSVFLTIYISSYIYRSSFSVCFCLFCWYIDRKTDRQKARRLDRQTDMSFCLFYICVCFSIFQYI